MLCLGHTLWPLDELELGCVGVEKIHFVLTLRNGNARNDAKCSVHHVQSNWMCNHIPVLFIKITRVFPSKLQSTLNFFLNPRILSPIAHNVSLSPSSAIVNCKLNSLESKAKRLEESTYIIGRLLAIRQQRTNHWDWFQHLLR